ncbi:T9SS type A sorting domain-containing protein [bacterium]|nr:T9SS type A sorting domain-containing protein [bacterium]
MESLRRLLASYLKTPAATNVEYSFLRFVAQALSENQSQEEVNALLSLCLARSDSQSKLLAADILASKGLFDDAIALLNANTYTSMSNLHKGACVRKALYYPWVLDGGYAEGISVVDTINAMQDSIMLRAFELYPLVYSRLSYATTQQKNNYEWQSSLSSNQKKDINILQYYPSPVADHTTIAFMNEYECTINIAIYNSCGQKIQVLADQYYSKGVHYVDWNVGNISNGLYFCRMNADDNVVQMKMLLIR